MPIIALDTGDAAELTELLQFLRDWLTTDDHLDTSLEKFVGARAYDVDHLRADLDRFTNLLANTDSEPPF
jgi:hypothetical protein